MDTYNACEDDNITEMSLVGNSSRQEGAMTLSETFSYQSYERENGREMLFSNPKNSSRGQTAVERSSARKSLRSEPYGRKTVSTVSIQQKILVMMVCLYLQFAVYGLVVAFGVIYVEIIDAFNATRAVAALIQSVYLGVTLGGGVVFAKILGRFNPGKCVVISSLIGTLALAGSAFGTNVVTLVVLVGVVLGVVMSCNLLATFVAISQTFTTNRKFALAILSFGPTFGQITLPFVTYALIEAYNWSGAFLILSGLVVLNCVPCGLIMTSFTRPQLEDGKHYTQSQYKTRSMFKDPLFYFYILMYFIYLTFGPVEQWFVVDMAVLNGISFEAGSTLLSVTGGAGLCGRLIGSVLIKLFTDLRPEIYMISGFTALAVAHYSLSIAPEFWHMVLAMILRGLSTGLVLAALPSMQIELNGVENYATTVASCNFVGGSGEFLGGYIGGYTVDVTGNYDLTFILATISAVYCAASFIAIYIVLRKRKRVKHIRQYQMLVECLIGV